MCSTASWPIVFAWSVTTTGAELDSFHLGFIGHVYRGAHICNSCKPGDETMEVLRTDVSATRIHAVRNRQGLCWARLSRIIFKMLPSLLMQLGETTD